VVALGLVAAVAASVAFNVGIVLQAADARREPAAEGLRLSLLAHLARRRRWIAGLLLGAVGFGLQVVALSLAPFVVVQPVLAAGLLLMLYLGVKMLGERVGWPEVAGVLGITAGIGLLAWGQPAGIETVSSQAALLSVMGAMVLVSVIPFALRGRGRLDSATFVIVASALAYGAGNIATKLAPGRDLARHRPRDRGGRADDRDDGPAAPPRDLRRPGLLRDSDLLANCARADLPDRALGQCRARRRASDHRPGADRGWRRRGREDARGQRSRHWMSPEKGASEPLGAAWVRQLLLDPVG
jgi:multidrug transporter EmrE-like cation transporter